MSRARLLLPSQSCRDRSRYRRRCRFQCQFRSSRRRRNESRTQRPSGFPRGRLHSRRCRLAPAPDTFQQPAQPMGNSASREGSEDSERHRPLDRAVPERRFRCFEFLRARRPSSSQSPRRRLAVQPPEFHWRSSASGSVPEFCRLDPPLQRRSSSSTVDS